MSAPVERREGMRLSIIIPTFNEERTIEQLTHCIFATPFPVGYELVVVDDHSSDRTFAIERRLRQLLGGDRIKVLRNRTNKGKGACIRQGLKHATGDLVIVQDGDLEYDPSDIPTLLGPVLEGKVDVVYGSRFLRRAWPSGMAWPNYLANRLLTWLTNRLYRLHLTDMETCYKLMRRELLKNLRVQANRFEFEPEITAKLSRCGIRIKETSISYHGRTPQEGKKIRAKDFFIAAWTLLRYRFWRTP
jgi:glycosyltransferase involved in cell wall biosynthesis